MIESDYVLTGSQGGIINLGLILMVRQLAKIGVKLLCPKVSKKVSNRFTPIYLSLVI